MCTQKSRGAACCAPTRLPVYPSTRLACHGRRRPPPPRAPPHAPPPRRGHPPRPPSPSPRHPPSPPTRPPPPPPPPPRRPPRRTAAPRSTAPAPAMIPSTPTPACSATTATTTASASTPPLPTAVTRAIPTATGIASLGAARFRSPTLGGLGPGARRRGGAVVPCPGIARARGALRWRRDRNHTRTTRAAKQRPLRHPEPGP